MKQPTTCPDTLYGGTCNRQHCTYNHTTRVCVPCAAVCTSVCAYVFHITSEKHAKRVNTYTTISATLNFWCDACEVSLQGDEAWTAHAESEAHGTAVRAYKSSNKCGANRIVLPRISEIKNLYRCTLCRQNCFLWQRKNHLRAQYHKLRQRAALVVAKAREVEKERGGVKVSHLETAVELSRARSNSGERSLLGPEYYKAELKVSNISAVDTVSLSAKVSASLNDATAFSVVKPKQRKTLQPGESTTIVVRLTNRKPGVYEDRIDILVQCGNQRPFTLNRKLRAVVEQYDENLLSKRPTCDVSVKPVAVAHRFYKKEDGQWQRRNKLPPFTLTPIPQELAKMWKAHIAKPTVSEVRGASGPGPVPAKSQLKTTIRDIVVS